MAGVSNAALPEKLPAQFTPGYKLNQRRDSANGQHLKLPGLINDHALLHCVHIFYVLPIGPGSS